MMPIDRTEDARVASGQWVSEQLMLRVCAEYLEMPGLRLTPSQAQRLWGLDPVVCARVLDSLVQFGFLTVTAQGAYIRRGTGSASLSRLRMAGASVGPVHARAKSA